MSGEFDVRGPHALPAEQVLAGFETCGRAGLGADEVALRQARFGANAIPPPRPKGPLRRFLAQFNNVLIYILLVAALVTALLGHWVDTSVILGVVVINALIGFVQEGRAEDALSGIRDMLPRRARVLRDGRRGDVPADALVPGDIVALAAGDRVPADLRLIEARNLCVDESALTGESLPVDKGVAEGAADDPIADRHCMAHSGTLVIRGRALGVVTATGLATELGRISTLVRRDIPLSTPLMRQMGRFGQLVTWGIVLLAALAFLVGVGVNGQSADEMFLAAVGLAVAAIPEGLPAIMTIALAIGVKRMALRKAIIRRLPAVEALGAVTAICTDKTGTLTRNEMSVQQALLPEGPFTVSGPAYGPDGAVCAPDGADVEAGDPRLLEMARACVLCNDAEIAPSARGGVLAGEPTEGALLGFALKLGLDLPFEREAFPRLDAIPFESQHKYMASLHHDHAGHRFIYLKGAPERVLEFCTGQREGGEDRPLDRGRWHPLMEAAAADGMRLLAVALRIGGPAGSSLEFSDVAAGGFSMIGMLAISDPPREEALDAIRRCRGAGIEIRMITGDHASTAVAIARRLALAEHVEVLSGTELEAMDDAALADAVARACVFARTSPEHKLRLVQALQARGHVVAMTGDGVNDAPALRQADVGVAMGRKGTEAARDAAEMVLADDNFASIASAIEEGRTVYDNLRKAIIFILPTNGGEALVILVAILAGMSLPITPAQVLWVNMITAVTLALALAFEPAEPRIMERPPRDPAAPLVDRFLLWRLILVAVLLLAATLGLWLHELARGASMEVARTVAVNALVVGEVAYLFSARRLVGPALGPGAMVGIAPTLLAVAAVMAAQLLFTYAPAMQQVFASASIGVGSWLRIAAAGLAILIVVETEKKLVRLGRAPRGRRA